MSKAPLLDLHQMPAGLPALGDQLVIIVACRKLRAIQYFNVTAFGNNAIDQCLDQTALVVKQTEFHPAARTRKFNISKIFERVGIIL